MLTTDRTIVQHTPGPWALTTEIDRFHGGGVIRPVLAGGEVPRLGSPVAVVCDFNRYDRDAERQANARLIAAAPDLVAALLAFLEPAGDTLEEIRNQALAALRSAGVRA